LGEGLMPTIFVRYVNQKGLKPVDLRK